MTEMSMETETREVVLEIFDRKVSLFVDKELMGICTEIRMKAKRMLEELKGATNENEHFVEDVCRFLEESIGMLLGKDVVDDIKECRAMNITELTGVLCYIISEAGKAFDEMSVADE